MTLSIAKNRSGADEDVEFVGRPCGRGFRGENSDPPVGTGRGL